MTTASAAKPKGMCIATRCTTVDQFVDMFHRFVDEDSFFVSTVNTRPSGLETSFSVQLADGTPVLRGLCVVLQAWTTATSPFKTPGVRLGIKRLTANSMPIFERLLVTRTRPGPPPPPEALAAGTVIPTRKAAETAEIVAPTFSDTAATTVLPSPVPAESTPNASSPASPASRAPTSEAPVATPVSPPPEIRTPGSDLILPANPLMNLSDASLEGYVDCTLYEETGTFFPLDDDGSPIEELLPPPSAPPLYAPRPVGRLATPVEIITEEAGDSLEHALEIPNRHSRPSLPGVAPVVHVVPIAQPAPVAPVAPVEHVEHVGPSAPSLSPVAEAVPPALVMPSLEPAVASESLFAMPPSPRGARESNPAGEITRASGPPGKRGWLIAGGLVAAAGAVALWVAMTAGGTGTEDSSGTAKPALAPAVAEKAAVANEAAATPPEPPTTLRGPEPKADAILDAEAREAGSPLAGDGPCRVVVASTPAGSIVMLDGVAIAPSPITIATTCGRHKLDVKHPRYQLGTKLVMLKDGEVSNVDVRLQRPTHAVSITSQPTGATVFLDGHRAGTTPTVLSVMGFSNLKLEVKKTGYAPLSQKLYSKLPQDKVAVKLTRW